MLVAHPRDTPCEPAHTDRTKFGVRARSPFWRRPGIHTPCGAYGFRARARARPKMRNCASGNDGCRLMVAWGTGCESPHPEEARSAVSEDGRESVRCVHPSRRLLRKLLRMRSVFPGRLCGARSAGSALALSGRASRRMRLCARLMFRHALKRLMVRDGAEAPCGSRRR